MLLLLTLLSWSPQEPQTLRAPSVPLVVHDPYFSIWLPHDRPTDGSPTHWTGREWPIASTATIDGARWRLLGTAPTDAPALPCTGTTTTATRTRFHYRDAHVALQLTFLTPALPSELEVLARPLTYVTWTVASVDGKAHDVALTFEVTAQICVDRQDQRTAAVSLDLDDWRAAGVGSAEQPVLRTAGDDLRIDWGHAWLAGAGTIDHGEHDSLRLSASVAVTPDRTAEVWAMLAYDDEWSIRYFDRDLRPYWRRDPAMDTAALLRAGRRDRERLEAACRAFDADFTASATALGGAKYAELCALAYRQCLGGNKLCADAGGAPLLFPKENFSNGCIATVDVIYPMAPLFLLCGSDLAKAMLVPVLDYAASPRWRFPFAPHDLGTYPHATGQVYGGGERDETNQMPVEESANLLLLVAALAHREGDAAFAVRYWPQLAAWADYLAKKGFDPEQQLCTDDFAGHLAHNVNLSAKAILALGAFAQLCTLAGMRDDAARWRALAEQFAARWQRAVGDGDDTPLAFDKPGSWSQKYNLVWDSILGLSLFPPAVFAREAATYRRHLHRYGLPLDSRATYTKIDWTLWSACLSQQRADFDALVEPLWRQVHETTDRVPMCDWVDTDSGRKINMIARPVVGGFFVRFLQDEAVWRRWFERGQRAAKAWAPLPLAAVTTLAACALDGEVTWRLTLVPPADGWQQETFDDRSWSTGKAGFGTKGTPGAIVGTEWSAADIWLRRTFALAATPPATARLLVHHDEDAEIWLNGVLAAKLAGYTRGYERVAIEPRALAALRRGDNTIAVHCHQTSGGQFLDVGLVDAVLPR